MVPGTVSWPSTQDQGLSTSQEDSALLDFSSRGQRERLSGAKGVVGL